MKRLIILGAVWALAVAKPEVYKEKEDFQFSRSSSDEGTKSGFYGAQRGNMGGNYERAHNMDSLAQNQMGGLVKQVEGELGDGANTRTGSVYTAANSRGTFGSGHYDLSNLAGRNFQEGTTYGDSHSRSSLSSSSAYNAADYANSRSQSSRHSGYQAAHSGLNLQSGDLQSLDNTQRTGQYDYGRQSSHSAGYNAQSGFQQHSAFDTSNADLHSGYGSNVHTRLISGTPVRIIVSPGTRVAIPVAAQSYDIAHGSSLIDQNSLNSEAEVLSNDNQRTVYRPSNAKHYESSYNYRKQWEKHDTIPSTIVLPTTSTENSFPKNSELFEDSQARTTSDQYDASRVASQRVHSSNVYGGYNANVKSASSQSRTNYDAQNNGATLPIGANSLTNTYALSGYNAESNHQKASSDSSLNGYNQAQYNAGSRYHGGVADASSLTQTGHNPGYNSDLNSQVEDLNAKPKSYQSSYSYHKSWERQGDPYVIKPASRGYYDDQSSQRLSSGSTQNQGYTASGSHYQHSHQSGADCDENGHIRVARSYNIDQYQDTQQQSQNLEDLGQQVENLGQQTQGQWGQQVEDLGQQTQGQWVQQEGGQQAQSTWDNLEDLSQQSHNKWDEIHKTWDKFEDLGQKADNNWNQKDIGQKNQDTNNQFQNLDQKTQNDLGQHIQQSSEIEHEKNPQDVDQQAQDKWDFSSTGQHDQENYHKHNRDYHFEQSNQFNQQESQSEQDEPELFKYSQPSRRQNVNKNDQISLWDKFDNFASYQSGHQIVQQNKSKDDQVNSNDNQPNWNSVSRNEGMGQQSDNSEDNLDITSQFESHNLNNDSNVKPFWEQLSGHTPQTDKIHDIDAPSNTGYFHSQENNNQNNLSKNENSFQETSKFYESNWNIDSSSHRQEHTLETIPSNAAPLSNLWNKLGVIEQSTLIDEKNDFTHTNSQNSYDVNQEKTNQNKPNGTQTEKESPQDIGRGDIGPEDVSDSVVDKKLNRRFQTPVSEEVLSLNQQKPQDQINQNVNGVSDTNNTNTKHYYLDFQNQENLHEVNLPTIGQENLNGFEQNENLQQQNSYHSDLEQKDSNKFGQQNSQNFGQNYEQNLQDFGQQNLQNFEEHHYVEQQNYQNVGQNKLQDQNQRQQNSQDFGNKQILRQPNEQDFRQNREQQNVQDFGQNENLEQQNVQDFGQHENLEQQNVQDFGQHENLEQQNVQDFGQHENPEQQNSQDFSLHENMEQQNLQVFGWHENLEQQNLQDFGRQDNLEQQNTQNFDQHVNLQQTNLPVFEHENLEQQNTQDFGRPENLNQSKQVFEQHENQEQQNLQDFGRQENLEQQNTQNFDQHVNLQQTNLPVFEHENLEQQNTQDFGRPENLNQSKQVFEQHENQEQQNLQDFGRQENLEQQNTQNFDQHVNLQQTNLPVFEHENLEQQNTQDFGRPENLNQSKQVFEQHENQEQQNLQDFGQQENIDKQSVEQNDYLEKQNLQNLGHQYVNFRKHDNQEQSVTLDQQNIQDFGRQNKNLEQLSQDSEQNFKYSDKQEQPAYPENKVQSQINEPNLEEIEEPIQIKKQNNDLQSISPQSSNTVLSPLETETEKPGFWKSVGNKLSGAKSKIASWFQ